EAGGACKTVRSQAEPGTEKGAMNDNALLHHTRRHFFSQCGLGIGALALTSLLDGANAAAPPPAAIEGPLTPKKPHFAPKAKNVIYLFMAGGPSQLELFDYKPKLNKLHGEACPKEFLEGKRFAFMDSFTKKVPLILGCRRKFAQHGKAGTWVSEVLPYVAKIVDEI